MTSEKNAIRDIEGRRTTATAIIDSLAPQYISCRLSVSNTSDLLSQAESSLDPGALIHNQRTTLHTSSLRLTNGCVHPYVHPTLHSLAETRTCRTS